LYRYATTVVKITVDIVASYFILPYCHKCLPVSDKK